MCYLRPIIAAVGWWTTVNICHAVRSSEPPMFTNSVSIAHVPTWLWLRFSSKTQPWTLFQGAYRTVFVTAGNNYLKQLKPPFISKMSTISTWQNWRSQKTQQHRKSGDFGAVSTKYEIIYRENENGEKVVSRKWTNPVIIKKSDKNRIKTIKITKQQAV